MEEMEALALVFGGVVVGHRHLRGSCCETMMYHCNNSAKAAIRIMPQNIQDLATKLWQHRIMTYAIYGGAHLRSHITQPRDVPGTQLQTELPEAMQQRVQEDLLGPAGPQAVAQRHTALQLEAPGV